MPDYSATYEKDDWITKTILCELPDIADEHITIDQAIEVEHALFERMLRRIDQLERKLESMKPKLAKMR